MEYGHSEVIWASLTLLFILGVYLSTKVIRKSEKNPAATWAQRHVLITFILSFVLPLAAGVALINTVFGQKRRDRIKVSSVNSVSKQQGIKFLSESSTPLELQAAYLYEPVVKVIVTDDPENVSIKALNACDTNQLTLARGTEVECTDNIPVSLKVWIQDAKLHKKREIKNYVKRSVSTDRLYQQPNKLDLTPQKQSFLVIPTHNGKDKKVSVVDGYAELIYFLVLVLGVLSKYFWDYHEERKKGEKKIQFDPILILKSFIIAMLVYYVVQGLLDNESGKLSWGGVLLAYNNGFTWQTILTTVAASDKSR